MARPRRDNAVAGKRDDIASAAMAVMVRDGIAGTGLRQVAAEARLSTGSVLYYYQQFHEVVLAAIERMAEQYVTARRQAVASPSSPVVALRRLVALGLPDRIDGALAVLYQAHFIEDQDGQIHQRLAAMHREQRRMYEEVIGRGVADGVFAPEVPIKAIAQTALSLEDAHSLYALSGYGPGLPQARRLLRQYLSGALAAAI